MSERTTSRLQAALSPFDYLRRITPAPQAPRRNLSLTFGQARQLAGMTRWDFRDLLGQEGILRRYDVEELEEDLQTLETLE